MTRCAVCSVVSVALGKRYLMPLLGHRYPRLSRDTLERHLSGLDLECVGGLAARGWTINDVDVVGARPDAERLAKRLQDAGVPHPVHYCGTRTHHSCLQCAYLGVKLAFTGRGY